MDNLRSEELRPFRVAGRLVQNLAVARSAPPLASAVAPFDPSHKRAFRKRYVAHIGVTALSGFESLRSLLGIRLSYLGGSSASEATPCLSTTPASRPPVKSSTSSPTPFAKPGASGRSPTKPVEPRPTGQDSPRRSPSPGQGSGRKRLTNCKRAVGVAGPIRAIVYGNRAADFAESVLPRRYWRFRASENTTEGQTNSVASLSRDCAKSAAPYRTSLHDSA